MLPLDTPLQFLKGVGPKRAADLQRVGLTTIEDLLYRFPIRYEDRGHLQPISTLKPGQQVAITGRIQGSGLRTTRRPGFKIFEAIVGDSSGSIRAVWMNQSFLKDILRPHVTVSLFGLIEPRQGLQLTNPDYEVIDTSDEADGGDDASTVHTGRIVPVYEKAGAMTPKMQRRLVHDVLSQLPGDLSDPFPSSVRGRMGLPDRREGLADADFPQAGSFIETPKPFRPAGEMRLIFEEFFLFQPGVLLGRRSASRAVKP